MTHSFRRDIWLTDAQKHSLHLDQKSGWCPTVIPSTGSECYQCERYLAVGETVMFQDNGHFWCQKCLGISFTTFDEPLTGGEL